MTIEQAEESSAKKSKLLVAGVVVLAIFVIGQYAAMYLPANIGASPKQFSLFNSILWSSLFFLFLWKLLGMKKIYGFILGVSIGSISFFGASFLAGYSQAVAAKTDSSNPTEWVQSELTETYMKGITKNECMYKTVAFLNECDSDNCLKTMAGVSGDCVTYAQGALSEFCTTYEANFTKPYCSTGVLSQRACKVIEIGKSMQCK